MAIIAPSILSADHGRLNDELSAVATAGADWIHVDVMDGHFVPNLTLGPPLIHSIRKATKLPFDVHLMIEKPELSIQQYVDAGANRVTVHAETCPHLHRTLAQIRDAGALPGVALNPATPVAMVENVLHLVDLVLVMTVNPGFSGQSFIPETLPKIRTLRAHGRPELHIQVDGGVGPDTIGRCAAAGADVFVAGSAVFGAADYAGVIQRMRAAAAMRDRAAN